MISSRLHIFILSLAGLFAALPAFAQTLPDQFTIEGRLYNSGVALGGTVDIKLEVIDSANTSCVLYREVHSNVDLGSIPATQGIFALKLGAGTRSFAPQRLSYIFSNGLAQTGDNDANNVADGACNVTPGGTSQRLVKMYVSQDSGATYTYLGPDTAVTTTPTAMVAETLQGRSLSGFILANTALSHMNQTDIETVFSNTNYTKLIDLLAGTSTQYMLSSPTAAVGFNNQRIVNVAAPTAATDAATKGYADGSIGGKSADVSGVGPAAGNGHTLIWDQATQKWTTGIPTANDPNALSKAGGTMTGAITMGGNDLLGTGHITMSPQKTITLGTYTMAQETTLITTLTAAHKGASWYNSTTNELKVWDGTAAVAQAYLTAGKIPGSLLPANLIVDGGNSNNAAVQIGTNDVQDLHLRTNNAAKLTIKANGNVGIGTTSPGVNPLAIEGTYSGMYTARIKNLDANGSGAFLGPTNDLNRAMYIGVTGSNFTTSGIYQTNTAVVYADQFLAGLNIGTEGNKPVTFWTNNGEKMRLHESGGLRLVPSSLPGTPAAGDLVFDAGSSNALKFHDGSSWKTLGTGTVKQVSAGVGLKIDSGAVNTGSITSTGTLNIDVGNTVGQIVAVQSGNKLPGLDGSLLTNVNAVTLQSRTVATTSPNDGEVLTWSTGAGNKWVPSPITLASNSVTTSKIADDSITAPKINSVGIAINRLLITDQTIPNQITYAECPIDNQVLGWTAANGWVCQNTGTGDFLRNGTLAMTGNLNTGGNSVIGNTTTSANLTLESTTSATKGFVLLQPNGGNVGIGTSNPNALLQVGSGSPGPSNKAALFTGYIQAQNASLGAGVTTNFQAHNTNGLDTSGSSIGFYAGSNPIAQGAVAGVIENGSAFDGQLQFRTLNANSLSTKMTIKANGNVGIGTTNPFFNLDLQKENAHTTIRVMNTDSPSGDRFPAVNITNFIGTSGAGGSAELDLISSRGTFSSPQQTQNYDILGTIAAWGNYGNSTSTLNPSAYISFVAAATFTSISNNPTATIFWNNNGSAIVESMRIAPSGSVAIGTSAPNAKLDVHGHIGNSNTATGARPTLSNCGAATIEGNDTRGTVTLSTGTYSTCTITFQTPYASGFPPVCTVSHLGTGTPGIVSIYSISNSALVVNASQLSSGDKFTYICLQ